MTRPVRDITSSDLKTYGEIIAVVEQEAGRRDLREWLFHRIVRLTRSDFGACYIWDKPGARFSHGILHGMDPDNFRRYDQWYQFRDPHTQKLRSLRRVAFVEEAMPYDELRRTEFYNDFLRRDGLDHGMNLFLFDGARDLGDFRLWRAKNSPDYGEREANILENLAPYLAKALTRTIAQQPNLTERERDVVALVARGMRDVEISKILGIGFSTVRTHLNKAMDKTGASNRAELAAHFQTTAGPTQNGFLMVMPDGPPNFS